MKISALLLTLSVTTVLQAQVNWITVDDMSSFRNGHTMTALENGFLVTGGYDGFTNLKTAEEFETGTLYAWDVVGEMDSIRFEHKATSYEQAGNERVLISGGWDGGSINYYGTQIYDVILREFSDGPDMSVGRSGHTSTLLNDGRILLAGGYSFSGGNTAIADIFDPVTESITQVASMQTGRSYHTATLLSDGRVLVTGGFNPAEGFQMSLCEIYDPVADTWTNTSPMTFTRDYHAAVLLDENRVLVTGGRFFNATLFQGHTACEIYDVTADTWTAAAPLPEGQSYHQMLRFTTAVEDTECEGFDWVVLPGGTDESGFGIDLTFSPTYFYCIEGDTWLERSMTTDGRYAYAAAISKMENQLLISGGFDGTAELLEIPLTSIDAILNPAFSVVIFPQPVQNLLHARMEGYTPENWMILDINGRIVLGGNMSDDAAAIQSLNVSALPSGLYVLQFADNHGTVASGKFIKQ